MGSVSEQTFDEVDPHVLKTTALNLGFDAMLYGTKLMHEHVKNISVTFHG